MRYWLLALAIPLGALGCDSNGGDGDADVDTGPACVDSEDACNMTIPDCPDDQVCHGHRCICPLNREYEVQVVNASIYDRRPNNDCWDGEAPTCVSPDPYAVVCFQQESSYECASENMFRTSTIETTIMPVWNERFTIYVDRHTHWGGWVYDDDSIGDADDEDNQDDMIIELPPIFPLTIENLRNAGLRIESDGGSGTVLDLIVSPL